MNTRFQRKGDPMPAAKSKTDRLATEDGDETAGYRSAGFIRNRLGVMEATLLRLVAWGVVRVHAPMSIQPAYCVEDVLRYQGQDYEYNPSVIAAGNESRRRAREARAAEAEGRSKAAAAPKRSTPLTGNGNGRHIKR
jgi:hypothetical protein